MFRRACASSRSLSTFGPSRSWSVRAEALRTVRRASHSLPPEPANQSPAKPFRGAANAARGRSTKLRPSAFIRSRPPLPTQKKWGFSRCADRTANHGLGIPCHGQPSEAPSSIRPARDDADERTAVIHFTGELDRLATDLAVLDIAERARRQIHGGIELFAAMRALHGDEPGYVLSSGWATRLKHGLESVQSIDALWIEWFVRLPGHADNLHHATPSEAGPPSPREPAKLASARI